MHVLFPPQVTCMPTPRWRRALLWASSFLIFSTLHVSVHLSFSSFLVSASNLHHVVAAAMLTTTPLPCLPFLVQTSLVV